MCVVPLPHRTLLLCLLGECTVTHVNVNVNVNVNVTVAHRHKQKKSLFFGTRIPVPDTHPVSQAEAPSNIISVSNA